MTIVVTGRVELIRVCADQGAVGGEHLAGAEQFVITFKRRIVRVVGGIAEIAAWVVWGVFQGNSQIGIAAVIGKARVLRPDAGVDDANNDALARDALGPGAFRIVQP